jgi:hypothetical protein
VKFPGFTDAGLIILLVIVAGTSSVLAGTVEHVTDGGFEYGLVDMEIDRYPRYPKKSSSPFRSPARKTEGALNGEYSLNLPGLKEGGYRIAFSPVQLQPGHKYVLSFRLASHSVVKGSVEVRQARKKVLLKTIRLDKSGGKLFTFPFPVKSGTPASGFIVQLRLESHEDVLVDEVSLAGEGAEDRGGEPYIRLIPDSPMGVYDVAQPARMNVYARSSQDIRTEIVIKDFISGDIVSRPQITGSDNVGFPLFTERRGYYTVIIYCGPADKREVCARRGYAVINPDYDGSDGRYRYGIAMEEHGRRVLINASIRPRDYYNLVQKIGVGSIRIFSLAHPRHVSRDGKRFDFHQLNSSLALARQYGLSPLVELGSNSPDRIPDWMLSEKRPEEGFLLSEGIRTKKLRDRMGERASHYFDMDRYVAYLGAVMRNGRGQGGFYEIWNEPGHKFTVADSVTIAKLTRNVADKEDPAAVILGYCSTKGKESNVAPQSVTLPGYLEQVAELEGLNYIDILSYHSAHGYRFFGSHANIDNPATDYVDRLHRIIRQHDAGSMEIWDTERGVPWHSPKFGDKQQDESGTGNRTLHKQGRSIRQVLNQMPLIYASEIAQGVKRIFWFYMDSSNVKFARMDKQWGFFDAMMEPMPQLVAYDAMTEMLEAAEFIEASGDGVSGVYAFRRSDGSTVVLAYNTEGGTAAVKVKSGGLQTATLYDVMGNRIESRSVRGDSMMVNVSTYPVYVILEE